PDIRAATWTNTVKQEKPPVARPVPRHLRLVRFEQRLFRAGIIGGLPIQIVQIANAVPVGPKHNLFAVGRPHGRDVAGWIKSEAGAGSSPEFVQPDVGVTSRCVRPSECYFSPIR